MISAEVHDIVKCVYTDKRIKEFISKLKPASLQDDLMMHCISEIYRVAELYPGKIEGLQERKQMFAWFVGMAKIQLMSKRSTFYRKHRREFCDETLIDTTKGEIEEPFEFKVHDPKKERMIEYVYCEIERTEKPNRKWLYNFLTMSGIELTDHECHKKKLEELRKLRDEKALTINGSLFEIIEPGKDIPPVKAKKRTVPQGLKMNEKYHKSYSRTGNFGALMMEATPVLF